MAGPDLALGDQTLDADPKARDRRVVTVLFADIVGSTALIEGADAEAAMALLGPVLGLMADAVRRFGGTVAKRAGDGVMAIFGVPAAQEDHARRACHAALALQQAIEAHRARREATGAAAAQVRVGLGSGRVLVTGVEDAAGRPVLHDAAGPIVHLASRIEATAAPGAVNISEATCRLVRGHFDTHPLGTMPLKGFSQPQPVHRLLGPKKERAIPDAGEVVRHGGIPIRPPMLGRQNEVAEIGRLFARVAETGTGGILLVTGEAGIGKTRLLEEARPLLPSSALCLAGHALSFGQRLSYWPLIEMLRPLLGILEGAGEAAAWRALDAALGRLFPPGERDDILPYAATLLGIEVPHPASERVRYLDGEALARQVLRAGYRLFERLAQDAPVVLVIDDAHWLDGSSAALIEHLLPIAAEKPLLVCALSRPREAVVEHLREVGAGLLPPGALVTLALDPLTLADSERLVRALLGGDAGAIGRTRDQVLYKSGGNPFYIEEVVRALVDAEAIVRDGQGRWSTAVQHGEVAIPDTVQGVIMARVDRLDERLKAVLGVAAVIGRSFFHRVLRAVTEQGEELDERVARLKTVELIEDHLSAPELAYIFRHALVQESVYESLLLEQRRRLHGQVAACIEALFPASSQEFASVLALHYGRAQAWDKALHYLLRAAEQATRMAGDDEALLHYEEALQALSRAREA